VHFWRSETLALGKLNFNVFETGIFGVHPPYSEISEIIKNHARFKHQNSRINLKWVWMVQYLKVTIDIFYCHKHSFTGFPRHIFLVW
jgi:hypothetical protein